MEKKSKTKEVSGVIFSEPSLTEQHHAKTCTLSYILNQAKKTGYLPSNNKQMKFGDYSNISSLEDVLNLTSKLEDSFLNLSPEERSSFDNSIENFANYIETNDAKYLSRKTNDESNNEKNTRKDKQTSSIDNSNSSNESDNSSNG